VVTLVTALLGGWLFAVLTGKGARVDSGLLLTYFIGLTTMHAARTPVRNDDLPVPARYGAVPLVFFPAIVIYALVYEAIAGLLPVAQASTELTLIHVVVAVVFLGVYVAIETGVHGGSHRLYVVLLNAGQPTADSVLTDTEEYNEY
jgi:NAD(P)H-quinone oxidoreductase subunit 5